MSLSKALDELPQPQRTPAERLRAAIALYDEGIAIKRLNLKRQNPGADAAALESMLKRWLLREDEG